MCESVRKKLGHTRQPLKNYAFKYLTNFRSNYDETEDQFCSLGALNLKIFFEVAYFITKNLKKMYIFPKIEYQTNVVL